MGGIVDPEAYAWPNDPNGSLVPILEASVEAAKKRHPSASGDTPGIVLTAADRCDHCGAGALYLMGKVDLAQSASLALCHHHHGKHFPVMQAKGWKVVGQNPTLMAELYRLNRAQGESH